MTFYFLCWGISLGASLTKTSNHATYEFPRLIDEEASERMVIPVEAVFPFNGMSEKCNSGTTRIITRNQGNERFSQAAYSAKSFWDLFFITKVVNEIQITTYFLRETVIKCLEWAIVTDELVSCRACVNERAGGEQEGF